MSAGWFSASEGALVEEPKFKVDSSARRFLRWFVPPAGVAAIGLAVLLVTGHITGPFQQITVVRGLFASKREFFLDPQVKAILMAHGYQVHATPVGSMELAEKEDLDSFHFVFPSGRAAAEKVRERREGKHAVVTRPFYSPVVLGTYREYAEALVKAEVAQPQHSAQQPLYYDVELDKLYNLNNLNKLWSEYGLQNGNRIVVQTPAPCRTYSGSVLVGFLAFASTGATPQTEAEADEIARKIKPYFDVQGEYGEDMAQKYFAPEGRTFAPISVIYEHQYLAHQLSRDGKDAERVLLYPKAQHQSAPELISFTPEGDRIGQLLISDPQLRRRAVELGYHALGASGQADEDLAGYLAERHLPVPRSGVGDTQTFLPAPKLLDRMTAEIGGCR